MAGAPVPLGFDSWSNPSPPRLYKVYRKPYTAPLPSSWSPPNASTVCGESREESVKGGSPLVIRGPRETWPQLWSGEVHGARRVHTRGNQGQITRALGWITRRQTILVAWPPILVGGARHFAIGGMMAGNVLGVCTASRSKVLIELRGTKGRELLTLTDAPP